MRCGGTLTIQTVPFPDYFYVEIKKKYVKIQNAKVVMQLLHQIYEY